LGRRRPGRAKAREERQVETRRRVDVEPAPGAVARQQVFGVPLCRPAPRHCEHLVLVDAQLQGSDGAEKHQRGCRSRDAEAEHDAPGAPAPRGVCGPCRRGQQGEGSHGVQKRRLRQDEHEQDHCEAAGAAAEHVRAVQHVHPLGVVHQRQPDDQGAEEERHEESQVVGRHQQALPAAVEDVLGVKGQGLRGAEAQRHGEREREGQRHRPRVEARLEPSPEQREQRPACSEAEQGRADDEVGEVVPARHREAPHQGQLQAEHGHRDEKHGARRQGHPGPSVLRGLGRRAAHSPS